MADVTFLTAASATPQMEFQLHRAQMRHVAVTDEVSGGAWGGTTVKLQAYVAGKWFDIASASFTADGFVTLDLPEGRYGWLVTGGTGIKLVPQVI